MPEGIGTPGAGGSMHKIAFSSASHMPFPQTEVGVGVGDGQTNLGVHT